jgi:hypothetical protein
MSGVRFRTTEFNREKNMNGQAITFDPLLGLSILYGLVIVGVVIVLVTALTRVKVGHSKSLKEIFMQTRFLELTTVLVIIVSGTTLAWSDKLSEGVIALLSGIAGYVLGGLKSSKPDEEPSDTTETTGAPKP